MPQIRPLVATMTAAIAIAVGSHGRTPGELTLIHWPKPDPTRFDSPTSPPSGSGPSINGVNVSPNGLKLPDLAISASRFSPKLLLLLLFFPRSKTDNGEPLLAGLFALDLDGDKPLTTSSFNAEKKPCPVQNLLPNRPPPVEEEEAERSKKEEPTSRKRRRRSVTVSLSGRTK